MRLKRIELKNFKRLADYEAQFSSGINVVKGPLNEMGKSTLLDAIIVALFENPKSTANKLKGYASWGSGRQFRTSIEFEDEGQGYLLEKDFEKGTAKLIADNKGEEIDTFKEISAKMVELLGTGSDKLFLCSSCIRQSEVSKISSGEKEINESLEEIVSGGKESTLASQVTSKLDSKIAETRRGLDRPAKNPGIIAGLKNKLQNVSSRYDEVRDTVSRVEARKIELVEADKQLAQVKGQYENARALLEKNKQRKEIETSIENLRQKYSEADTMLGKVNTLSAKSEEARRALASIAGLENEERVAEFRRKLNAIQVRRKDIENSLDKLQREVTEAEQNLNKRAFLKSLSLKRSVAVAAAVSIAGIVGILIGPLYFLSLVIIGMAFVAAGMWARSILAPKRTEITDRTERIQRMNEALGELGEDEKKTLNEARCNTTDEYNKKEGDFNYWLNEQRNLQNQLVGMLAGRTVEEMAEQKRQITMGLAVAEAKLTDDLKETRLSPEEYVELERKVRSLDAKQAELEKQKRRCEAIMDEARFNIEDQIRLEEELEGLRDDLKREEKKIKAYGLARDLISRARTETLSSAGEALEKGIERYLAVFTNDKYKQVRVNKEALEFWVYSDEKGDWAKPEELSGGVIDEFYLAFRLALAKLIFGDRKPPLMLDDPFVNFDSVRLANTRNFFKTLASDYQIIIFTLSDLYDKVADNIILLGEKEKLL
jgi:DNA repair exonuclease SbcCD ATPase subunit